MPYRTAYDIVTGVEEASGHRVRVRIRVVAAGSRQPVPELRLHLVGDNTQVNVPVAATGAVDLPLDRAARDDGADIVANQPAKSLAVALDVVPIVDAGEIRYGDLVALATDGNAALRRIVPWYLRLFTSRLEGVALCYPEAGRSVTITGRGEGERAADVKEKDIDEREIYCARFALKEPSLDADTVLRAGVGVEAVFW